VIFFIVIFFLYR